MTQFAFYANEAEVLQSGLSGNDIRDLANTYLADDQHISRALKMATTYANPELGRWAFHSVDGGIQPNGVHFGLRRFEQVAAVGKVLREIDNGVRLATPDEILQYAHRHMDSLSVDDQFSAIKIVLGYFIRPEVAHKYGVSFRDHSIVWDLDLTDECKLTYVNEVSNHVRTNPSLHGRSVSLNQPLDKLLSSDCTSGNYYLDRAAWFDLPYNKTREISNGSVAIVKNSEHSSAFRPRSITIFPSEMLNGKLLLARD